MYEGKQTGRNRCMFIDEQNVLTEFKLRLTFIEKTDATVSRSVISAGNAC